MKDKTPVTSILEGFHCIDLCVCSVLTATFLMRVIMFGKRITRLLQKFQQQLGSVGRGRDARWHYGNCRACL